MTVVVEIDQEEFSGPTAQMLEMMKKFIYRGLNNYEIY